MQQACRDCHGEPPRVYPVGLHIPSVGQGVQRRLIRLCGICRLAVRWSQADRQIRVEKEDLAGFPGVLPGCYSVCDDCLTVLQPVVLERWLDEGIVEPGTTVRNVSKHMV